MPIAAIYICAVMLFLGVATLPYGYYTLLRLVVCGVAAFAAFITYERKNKILPWVFGFLALLFNPIVKIHLPKGVWALIDIGTGIFLLAMANAVRSDT